MRDVGIFFALVVALAVAGCGTTSSVNMVTGQLRSQPSVEIPPNYEVSAETIGAAAAIGVFGLPSTALGLSGAIISPTNAAWLYVIYDPLAPNWSIQEQVLSADTYRFSLRAKSFRTGGDGEAIQIVKRRALQLQRDKGYADYRILDYSEGVESSTPFTHRVSEASIQLVKVRINERR